MTKTMTITTLERVRQSQLGQFINQATEGDPMKVRSLSKLAESISLENNVDCKVSDLEEFYNFDEPIVEEDTLLALRMAEHGI